jgi:signal transduction histidine kinase/CheY-like chemotaxis protein
VENRGSYDLEYRVRSHAGNYEWFKVRSRAIRDSSGEIVRWFGAAVNVDDLVRAKTALREADQRKDEFLAMLAHELRNPLAPILSAVEILRLTRGTDHDPATFHDVIERQVQHLTLLVDDLLDVSRVSTGKIQLQNAPFDLVSAAEQAVEIHQPFINDRQHQLTVVLAAEPISIVGDSGRISQVIGNLLNNAAKYSEPGSAIHLIVDSDTTTSPPTAVVRVRDDGRGIDPAAIPHLFDLFFQDGRTLDRAEGGLGLGLSLVKSLVHLHGGSVDVHSAGRGHGAEFTVRLPLAPADAPALPPLPPVTQAPAPSAPKCILVVDDNVHLADSMTELLRLTGHDVHTARDGQQAVDLAVDLRPDVILMDIGLPKLNGYDACRAMRRAGLHDTLIVAITGYGQPSDRALSQQASFDAHLVKPVSFNSILDIIEGSTALNGDTSNFEVRTLNIER